VKWVNITGKNDNNDDNDILVAACMHAGCKVYHLSGGCGSNNNNGKYSISSTCIYHDDSNNHLAYGIDVISNSIDTIDSDITTHTATNMQIAMCSFYDNKVDIVQCNL